MTKYFKLDKDSREIILDKTKHYNVNIDILDLIIDLKQDVDRLEAEREELKQILNNWKYSASCHCYNCQEDYTRKILEILERNNNGRT